MSQPPIGIDLGTTNSLVSAFVDGKPQLIPNALGEFLTPSVVSISDGELIVGKGARERLFTHRDKTISLFKRKMGTQSQIKLGAEAYSPAELSSFVLSKLLKMPSCIWGVKYVTLSFRSRLISISNSDE
ncbi:molecular chaperone HscC [Thalassospira xiamenensis M-5 = DSM 17429]|uniref:Chaperone protein HscC n=1 Tax=Thalassospira xiamenensis M-5 = DSM 17429 TaxID=1123366 RepID=A0AB72UDI0_9PROT|nr:Hsp70 family protein [Thalassospira xiamenensis]AJD52193.1 chaperone protein HscC [Thalassospira xiamenensis M-5 = DSM 17429]SIS89578.1 molecular chaperone HscC [Thalassospira xiamenensis M-5 = DSM 17429]